MGTMIRYGGAEDEDMSSVVLPCDPARPGSGNPSIQDLVLASDAVSGVSVGCVVSRPRKRSSPGRRPSVPRLASGALTAMSQVTIEAAGLGARREMELVAVNQTLQAQAKAAVSAVWFSMR
jgi:hypothetical protein